ncbi:pleckstrin homology-like domain family B member 1 isoform X1 [Rhopilema esculentum]|uniref:pleckstrin homology-like domain family B member 1 isoform X1 n=1 Tax=Rhopilema esculentum TaxID=499914 RepID=UPI0031D61A2A
MEAVKVGVCIRSLTKDEKSKNLKNATRVDGNQLKIRFGDGREKTFTWDYGPFVLADDKSQNDGSSAQQVHDSVSQFIIKNAFQGYNTSVFTYGAKDTGKSWILFGDSRKHGLIHKVMESVYDKASAYDESTTFRTELSFLEVCGNDITDLISERSSVKSSEGSQKLKVREHPDMGVYIEKLSKHIVTDANEAKSLMEKAIKRRRRLAALDPSSRGNSHAIFRIVLTQARIEDELPLELISKITIIDLSSRDKNLTNGHPMNGHVSDVIEEEEVKGGLEVLNDVITSLASQNYANFNSSMSKWGNPVVPYRDSVLTWMMKETLGGNSESLMLCCISACEKTVQETVNCLKYGSMVRNIINKPVINEDSNVKLIRELKAEIDALKEQAKSKVSNGPMTEAQKKLQRDTELMQRLTGIWEEKWSKAQKLMEEKSLDVTDLGSAVKLETKQPHFVSLGGGRLSVGVSIIPIKKGNTVVGLSDEVCKPDLEVQGNGVVSNHCMVEYDGDVVVLHPGNGHVSVDGIPITEATRLPQGSMICLGKNNYFRFNHPKEAARIKQENPNIRFSIVPDNIYPDVQLAIEQRRKEMQEKEKLKAENKRLLALEQQYVQSLERLSFEKEHVEQERRKLQALQQQQQSYANQFDREISIQIEELELKRRELRKYEHEKEKLLKKEKEIELAGQRLVENRTKQEKIKAEFDSLECKQEKIELDEFEKLEEALMKSVAKEDKESVNGMHDEDDANSTAERNVKENAVGDLDSIEEDLRLQEMYRQQRVEIDREKRQLEEMEKLHKKLESQLAGQIEKLQGERESELEKINKEKTRLKKIEEKQESMLRQIENEKNRIEVERLAETQKMQEKVINELKVEEERVNVLKRAAEEQQKERELINAEKERLLQLEQEHIQALQELQLNKLSQQEKLERERQLELEYIETEQLMLEELEQKQFESARQMEYGAQLLREQLQKESNEERRRLEENRKLVDLVSKRHEDALKEAEQERKMLQEMREKEQDLLRTERERLNKKESEYKDYIQTLEDEKKVLKEELEKQRKAEVDKEDFKRSSSLPMSFKSFQEVDPAMLRRCKTPEDKMKEIEENKQRLDDLRKQVAEKAELEWKEKKERIERQQKEERDLEEKRIRLEEMRKEQERQAEHDRSLMQEEADKIRKHEEALLQKEKELEDLKRERDRRLELELELENERVNENKLEQSLEEEKRKLETLEKTLSEERNRRQEIEKRLEQKEKNDEVRSKIEDRKQTLEARTSVSSSNIKHRIPSYTPSIRSFPGSMLSDDINLLHHIVASGHILENCPSVKINKYSCRGYLSKMGRSRFHSSWTKRWFVFDRKLRALCYYQDERKTKPKGVIYFQAIQEVYVDNSAKKSPNPKTTFCVKTPQRNFLLSASSPIAMSIWIDVICTGKEGALC